MKIIKNINEVYDFYIYDTSRKDVTIVIDPLVGKVMILCNIRQFGVWVYHANLFGDALKSQLIKSDVHAASKLFKPFIGKSDTLKFVEVYTLIWKQFAFELNKETKMLIN